MIKKKTLNIFGILGEKIEFEKILYSKKMFE